MVDINNLDKHSFEVFSGVYFLFREGVVVYIGESTNVLKRIGEHEDKSFDEYSYVKTPKNKLKVEEKKYIKMYSPLYNITHNSKEITPLIVIEFPAKLAEKEILIFEGGFYFVLNGEKLTLKLRLNKKNKQYSFQGHKGFINTKSGNGEIMYNNIKYYFAKTKGDYYKFVF